jgi:uncharacterized protein
MQEPQYVVPRIDILEQPAAQNPQTTTQLNRIGVVGTASWGTVNTPYRCYTDEFWTTQFGGYKVGLTGYPTVHGAFQQGNQDITFVRIAGASAKQATLVLEDATSAASIDVTAKYPGTLPIDVEVQNGTNANTVKLIVTANGSSTPYDNQTLATVASINDSYVTFAEAAGAAELPKVIAATPLAGGDDGSNAIDTDYAAGLQTLATVPVSIVVAAQQTDAATQAAVVAHAMAQTVRQGLRNGVASMPIGQTVATSATNMSTLSGMRGIMSFNAVQPDDYAPNTWIVPDGYYAGVLALLNAKESPSNKVVQGISAVQYAMTDDDVYTATQARMSPITLDALTGNFIIRNGVNMFVMPTSGGDDWSQINVRREFDKLEMEIYVGTQWAQSNTDPKLPTLLATWIDEHLRKAKVNNGEITDYQPTVASRDSNNPRRITTKISVQPDYAADFIDNYVSQWDGA